MEKVYEYENAIIYVTSTKSCDKAKLRKATEEFMKKVISGGKKNGYINTTRDFDKK